MATVNYVNTVQIGSASASVAASGTALTSLSEGQFALVEATTLTAVDAAGAALIGPRASVFIARGEGSGEFKLSSLIKGNNVKNYAATPGSSAESKVDYVEVASILADETGYELIAKINDDQRVHGQKQTRVVANYTTGTSATTAELVFGLTFVMGQKKQNGSVIDFSNRSVDIEAVSEGNSSVGDASDNDGAIQYGSDVMFFSAGVSFNTGGTTVEVGGYVHFQGRDASNKATNYWYKVTDVDSNNIYFDRPTTTYSTSVSASEIYYVDATTAEAKSFK